MRKLLLRLFVKNHQNTADPRVRSAIGKLSGFTGIICNLLLFAGKLLAGILSGSVSITADAMNNLSDSVSSVVTLIGFRLAEKPADKDHPYGHARYEYLSGLAVAALIIVIGFELGKNSLEKILNPQPVELSLPVLLILLGSVLVKLWLFLFNRRLGKDISSGALLAASEDSRNDAIATSAVLLAALVELLTQWQVDGYMGLAVAVFILYSGVSAAKQTISPLLGETASPELRQLIVDILRQDELVLGYHDLMVHDYGPGQRFASLHVEMDQSQDPLLCHEHIDNLERVCLQQHNVHLVIHYDPIAVGDETLESLKTVVLDTLHQLDQRLSIHDFRMVKGLHSHTNLIFDVALPYDMSGREDEIRGKINDALASLNQGTYYTVITFDPEFFNKEED